MQADRSAVLSSLFDKKTVALLKSLLTKRGTFCLRELAREAGLSPATTYRILRKLIAAGLISKESRGKNNYYLISRGSRVFEDTYALIVGTLPTPTELLKQKLLSAFGAGFQLQVTKGSDGREKVLIISDTVQPDKAKQFAEDIFAETGKQLNHVVLSTEQFAQMKAMNIL